MTFSSTLLITSPAQLPVLVLGNGAPLVVIPGMDAGTGMPGGLSRRISELEIAGLSRGARVWWVGRTSGLSATTSISELAESYASTLREEFREPVDVVGVSTGGSIALQLALDHPEQVRKLVLVSAAHRLGDHGRAVQASVAALLAAGRPRRASAVMLSNVGVSAPARAVLGVLGWLSPGLVIGSQPDDLRVLLEAEDSFDLTERLAALLTPTLMIAGARDRFYSRALYEECAAALPNASLRLANGGHLSMHANRRVAREVLAFVR